MAFGEERVEQGRQVSKLLNRSPSPIVKCVTREPGGNSASMREIARGKGLVTNQAHLAPVTKAGAGGFIQKAFANRDL